MSLFGNLGQTERKTGTLFGNTSAPAGGLFGQSQQQTTTSQPAPNLFGSTAAPQQNTGGLFGASQSQPHPQSQNTGGLFSQSQQPQQQQQQPQPNLNNSLFGGRLQPAPSLNAVQAQQLQNSQQGLPQLRQSSNTPFASSFVNGQSK